MSFSSPRVRSSSSFFSPEWKSKRAKLSHSRVLVEEATHQIIFHEPTRLPFREQTAGALEDSSWAVLPNGLVMVVSEGQVYVFKLLEQGGSIAHLVQKSQEPEDHATAHRRMYAVDGDQGVKKFMYVSSAGTGTIWNDNSTSATFQIHLDQGERVTAVEFLQLPPWEDSGIEFKSNDASDLQFNLIIGTSQNRLFRVQTTDATVQAISRPTGLLGWVAGALSVSRVAGALGVANISSIHSISSRSTGAGDSEIFIISDTWIESWVFSFFSNQLECLWRKNPIQEFRDWFSAEHTPNSLAIIDFQCEGKIGIVLVAARYKKEYRYAVAFLKLEDQQEPSRPYQFTMIKRLRTRRKDVRMSVICEDSERSIFLYSPSKKSIYAYSTDGVECHYNLTAHDPDVVLGVGVVKDQYFFVSLRRGIQSMRIKSRAQSDSVTFDAYDMIKAAWECYRQSKEEDIVYLRLLTQQLYASESSSVNEAVKRLSTAIIDIDDDYVSSVPPLSRKTERLDAFNALLKEFPDKAAGKMLVSKLGKATRFRLCENQGLLEGAVALQKCLGSRYGSESPRHPKIMEYIKLGEQVIQDAMGKVVDYRGDELRRNQGLNNIDIFFSKVSLLPQILDFAGRGYDRFGNQQQKSSAIFAGDYLFRSCAVMSVVNNVFTAVLSRVQHWNDFHPQHAAPLLDDLQRRRPIESWNSSVDVSKVLMEHVDRLGNVMKKVHSSHTLSADRPLRCELFDTLLVISTVILKGFQERISGTDAKENEEANEYVHMRSKIMGLLATYYPHNDKDMTNLYHFARQFEDYPSLIDMSFKTGHVDRLLSCMEDFGEAFAREMFSYFHKKGLNRELLGIGIIDMIPEVQASKRAQQKGVLSLEKKFDKWLDVYLHENNIDRVSWMHDIKIGELVTCAETQLRNAGIEKSLEGKQIALSFAKLALFCSAEDTQEEMAKIDNRVAICDAQEYLFKQTPERTRVGMELGDDEEKFSYPESSFSSTGADYRKYGSVTVLKPDQLIKQLVKTGLDAYSKGDWDDCIYQAFAVYERSLQERNDIYNFEVLVKIWKEVVSADNDRWNTVINLNTSAVSEDWTALVDTTALAKTLRTLVESELKPQLRGYRRSFDDSIKHLPADVQANVQQVFEFVTHLEFNSQDVSMQIDDSV